MKKTAFLGIFLALALLCSYVESLIPFSFGIPGIKLGLTNIVVILMLYYVGAKEAFCLSMLRVVLAGLLFGNLFSILYSFAGAVLSFACMLLVKSLGKFRVLSVSAVGGITHNLGQILAAVFVIENRRLFYYFPFLFLAGTVTGVLIGIISQEILLRLPPALILDQKN